MDEPIANSSQLVLPTTTAPAASRRSTTVGVVGRVVALEDPRAAVVGMPRVQMLSLTATARRASGRSVELVPAGVELRRAGRSHPPRRHGGTRRAGGRLRDAVERRCGRRRGRRAPGGDRVANGSAAVCGSVMPPRTRGTLKRPAARSASGRRCSASSRGSEGRASSSRSGALQASGWEVGATPLVSTCGAARRTARMPASCRANSARSSAVSASRASRAMRSTSSGAEWRTFRMLTRGSGRMGTGLGTRLESTGRYRGTVHWISFGYESHPNPTELRAPSREPRGNRCLQDQLPSPERGIREPPAR